MTTGTSWGHRVRLIFGLVFGIGVLGLGALLVVDIARSAPALSTGLRVAVAGTWRPDSGTELYDRARYAGDRAQVLIASSSRNGGADTTVAEPSEQAVTRSLELTLDAVEGAPADAYAWTLLAASAWANGYEAIARSALLRSHELAPSTAELAIERLAFADLYSGDLEKAERAALLADVEIARLHRTRELDALLQASPGLRAIVEG